MTAAYKVLISQGFVRFPEGESNIIHAEKAFVGNRAIEWIHSKAKEPKFNLQPYLVALTYYKLDLADLKFEENELLYRYRGVRVEGSDDEFYKDDLRATAKFHRPDQTINSDGTIGAPPNSEKPPQGDE